jgi:hypothetical protein
MRKSAMTDRSTSALIALFALLVVATPFAPAVATTANQAAGLCKKNKNCDGAWGKNGDWSATVCNPGDECRLVYCPAKGDCSVSQRRGTKVLGVLKPSTGGLKPPSSGQAGHKKTGVPAAGVKLPTGFNQPTGKPPSASSGKRR